MWFDLEETVAAVLAILRLTGQDVDEPRLRALVPTAAARIEKWLDRSDPMPDASTEPLLQEGLQLVTLEMYRQPATAGSLVGLTAEVAIGVLDPIAPAAPLLQPYRQLWAVA